MRSFGIVLLSELFDKHSGFGQAGEESSEEEFITEAAVEALAESILPGAARCDEVGAGPLIGQPCLERMGDELRTIVAPKKARSAMRCEQSGQHADHALSRDRCGHIDGPALSGMVIANGQHLKPRSSGRRIEDEIIRPDMVWMLGNQRYRAGWARRLAFPADPARNLKPLLLPDTVYPIAARLNAFAVQIVMGLAATTPSLLDSKVTKRLSKSLVVIWTSDILVGRAIEPKQPTGVALGETVVRKKPKGLLAGRLVYYFFARYS